MLEPQGRLSIYDIVRPPTGFVLDCLIATTYTTSLDTVLSLPAAMLADIPGIGRRTAGVFTATELAALRRVCDRTAIFCQGAAIHPASDLPSAVIEAETMVHEVVAPNKGAFHPKVWVMQFKHGENQRTALRVVVMSRNITEDRSWDAGLVLDSKPSPGAEKPNDLGLLLRSLAGLCIRPLDQTRRDLLTELATKVERARWKTPDKIGIPTFHLTGDAPGRVWVQPQSERLAIISPFLSTSAVAALARTTRACPFILSRPDALAQCWPHIGKTFDRHMVLTPPGEPVEAPRPTGLHAKILLWENRSKTRLAIGSMNATAAAIGGRNVEFMASFDCTAAIGEGGIDALLERRGLGMALEDFEPDPMVPQEAKPFDDRPARSALLDAKLHLECAQAETGWTVTLVAASGDAQIDALLPNLRFRPATLASSRGAACGAALAAGNSARFPGTLELAEITGFTVFEADGPDGPIAFVLNLEVRGIEGDARRNAALKALLPDQQTFSLFLRILLGDFHSLETSIGGGDGGSATADWQAGGHMGLLEMLVRCAADDPDRLKSVEQTLDALGVDQLSEVTTPEFRDLWSTVLAIARDKP